MNQLSFFFIPICMRYTCIFIHTYIVHIYIYICIQYTYIRTYRYARKYCSIWVMSKSLYFRATNDIIYYKIIFITIFVLTNCNARPPCSVDIVTPSSAPFPPRLIDPDCSVLSPNFRRL